MCYSRISNSLLLRGNQIFSFWSIKKQNPTESIGRFHWLCYVIHGSGSIPSGKKRDVPKSCVKWESFIGRREGQEVISKIKERIVSGKVAFPVGKRRGLNTQITSSSPGGWSGPMWQRTSLVLTRKYLTVKRSCSWNWLQLKLGLSPGGGGKWLHFGLFLF